MTTKLATPETREVRNHLLPLNAILDLWDAYLQNPRPETRNTFLRGCHQHFPLIRQAVARPSVQD